jgi:ATP-binding cassette subfamily B protein/subfamily B ATP-binding cassette protein MsbA
LFGYGISSLTENEKEGVKLAFRFMLRHPLTLTIMLVTGLAAAIFEGGTLGILGLAVGVLTGEAGSVSAEITPFMAGTLDKYFGNTSAGGLFLTLVGLAVVAQMVKGALTYISTVVQIKLAYGMQGDAQDRATNHVLNMNYSEVSSQPSGKLVAMVEQTGIVSSVVSEVGKASRALLMVVSYVSVMLLISPILTLLSVIIYVLLLLSFNRLVSLTKKLSKESFISEVDTSRWAVEFIGLPRLLRIFGASAQAGRIIKEARHKRISAERKSATLIAIVLPAFEVITVFGAGIFLVMGYYFAGGSAIEVVPKLFVFVLVFFRLKPQVKLVNDLRISIVKLLPRLEIIGEFLRDKSSNYERVGGLGFEGVKSAIVLRDVCFAYPETEQYVLNDVSFSINRGETIAIVGPSGAGKSTIINLILDLYSPTTGEILVDGISLETLDLKLWRDKIGVVDQEIMLLNTTIENNINFGRPDLGLDDIESAAKVAHAHGFISQLQDGYQTIIGDKGYRLSGGQKQRLALARAVARKPDILLLDEATSSLDSISERLIQKAIEEMHESFTILVIAHRLATVVEADNIFVLDNGQLVESGSYKELIDKKGMFRSLWEHQI